MSRTMTAEAIVHARRLQVADAMVERAHMAARPLLIGKATCRAMLVAVLCEPLSDLELAGNGMGLR